MVVLLNSAATKWLRLDQLILDYINSSLSDAHLSQVINCETSYDAWEVLETLYGRHKRDRIKQMRGELQALKKSCSSMEEYLHKAKSWSPCLHGARKPTDDDEFILYILCGLGLEFDPIVATLNATDNFPLENVIGKLRDFDLRISFTTHNNTTIALYTNYATRSKSTSNKTNSGRGSNS